MNLSLLGKGTAFKDGILHCLCGRKIKLEVTLEVIQTLSQQRNPPLQVTNRKIKVEKGYAFTSKSPKSHVFRSQEA